MSQPEATVNPGEDRPIIVGGGPQMITVDIPDSSANGQRRTISIAPKDPAVPFREIVITEGTSEVFRFPLSGEWKVTII
jgi:hypothetical protein